MRKIFVINLGSTSTKMAVFAENERVNECTEAHDPELIKSFPTVYEQIDFRRRCITGWLEGLGQEISGFDAIAVRGGLVKPIPSGTYIVNQAMLEDMENGNYGEHATNLGARIAHDLVSGAGLPCYIVDPVVVDERLPEARLAGHPLFQRVSIFHALNQKAVARRAAREIGRSYEECNFVVAHLGGGISVGAHRQGRVIDANNGLIGEGPFSPERSGSLPADQLVELCFSGKYSKEQVLKMLTGQGGVLAYLGSTDLRYVEQCIDEGDEQAHLVFRAMVHQIIKEVGAYAAVLGGNVDAIIITGGMARSARMVNLISDCLKNIAALMIYPGEDEMGALAQGALRVLNEEEEAKIYG